MTYIIKIFIPFLENLTFFSPCPHFAGCGPKGKKEDSFKDWKTIVLIKLRENT